jgi:predicted methyltransferase
MLPADAHVDTRPDLLRFADPACSQRVIPTRHTWAIFAAADPAGPVAVEVHGAGPGPSDTGYVLDSAGCREDVKSAGYPVSAEAAPLHQFVRLVATP